MGQLLSAIGVGLSTLVAAVVLPFGGHVGEGFGSTTGDRHMNISDIVRHEGTSTSGTSTGGFGHPGGREGGNKWNISSTSVACVAAAVATREQSIDSAQSAFSTSVNSAYTARASALQSAYTQSSADTIRSAVKAAWQSFNAAVKTASKTWKSAQQSAWKAFNTAARACNPTTSILDSANSMGEMRGE